MISQGVSRGRSWERVPFFLSLAAIGGLAMLGPALLALADGDRRLALVFTVCAVVTTSVAGMAALALSGRRRVNRVRENLLGLFGAFTLLPIALAWPLVQAVPGMAFLDAYLEMVSAATTTGFNLEPETGAWPRAVHLWRALSGWLGGFLMWTAAVAILAPMHLGGAELVLPAPQERREQTRAVRQGVRAPGLRLRRAVGALLRIYVLLSFVLWVMLVTVGEDPFVALCHAMSTLATSGISPVGGLGGGGAGLPGEAAVFVFFLFALTRRSFTDDLPGIGNRGLAGNPEIRTALVLVLMVTGMLFVRHWVAFVETAEVVGLTLIPRAVWGAVFTSASFLTTTGFVSENWEIARLWSGLSTPGMALLGLALIGGGMATTAGGVKLLRIYVLYKHTNLELSRLVHPSTVGGIGTRARPVRRQAGYMAWLVFMLIALGIAVLVTALSLADVAFEPSVVLTLAAITNTGPLAQWAAPVPIPVADLPALAKMVLCLGMVLGRVETLAVIALMNPDFWRR